MWTAFVGILKSSGIPWGQKKSTGSPTPSHVHVFDTPANRAAYRLKNAWGSTWKKHAKWDDWTSEPDICSWALNAGKPGLWLMFTESRRGGPPYLRCCAESRRSDIVLWLFGIYLVIRPLKSIGGMKASALLNLLLLAYFVSREVRWWLFINILSPRLCRTDHLSRFELPRLHVDLPQLPDGLKGCRVAFRGHAGEYGWCWSYCENTHLGLAALRLLLLDVHDQHLAAEREALGLLDHLLVRRDGVVSHDHVALQGYDETRLWSRRCASLRGSPRCATLQITVLQLVRCNSHLQCRRCMWVILCHSTRRGSGFLMTECRWWHACLFHIGPQVGNRTRVVK